MTLSLVDWLDLFSSQVELEQLSCLFIDVQATGASPRCGHLLELSLRLDSGRAHDEDEGTTALRKDQQFPGIDTLVMLPPGQKIPRKVTQLTGIKGSDLVSATSPKELARDLWHLIEWIQDRLALGESWVWVAHVARYERAFVRALCLAHLPDHLKDIEAELSFDKIPWLCTHAISVRRYPSLPRRTLNAINGVYGGEIIKKKRARPHRRATELIWRSLKAELIDDQVNSWGALCALIALPATRPKFQPPLQSEKRLNTPRLPGIYSFIDDQKRVIYVGMARNLHQRVNQHFRGQKGHDEHHLELISITRDLTFMVTPTVLEAKLMENREIKRLSPKYNRALTSAEPPLVVPLTSTADQASIQPFYRIEQLDDLSEQDLVLGPMIDRGLVDALKVYQSACHGDFTSIHYSGWPSLSVTEWKSGIEVLERILAKKRDWQKERRVQSKSQNLLNWLAWGREIRAERSIKPLSEDQRDKESFIERASNIADRLWAQYQEGMWQRLLVTGELLWSADQGGASTSLRAIQLDAYRTKDLPYPRSRKMERLPETLLKISSHDQILAQLPSLKSTLPVFSRVAYDEARLTYLTVSQSLNEGQKVLWRPYLGEGEWYELSLWN